MLEPIAIGEIAASLRSLIADVEILREAIIADRASEPVPYAGSESRDPLIIARRLVAREIRRLSPRIEITINYQKSKHDALLAWIVSGFEFYLHLEEVTFTTDDGSDNETEFLAFFASETEELYRFERDRSEWFFYAFRAYAETCEAIAADSDHKYHLNQYGELEEAAAKSNGRKKAAEIPVEKYTLQPGKKGGGKITRNALRKVILMFEGTDASPADIARTHNTQNSQQPKATPRIVRTTRRAMRVQGLLGDDAD